MSKAVLIGDTSRSQKIKVILALAVPAMIENFLQTVVGFVDTLFVAKIGLNEVAAVGVTNAIVAVYIAVFMAMGVGTSSLIARSVGAGELEKAKAIARQSTWISAILGLVFGIITLFFAEPLLRLMGAEPRVLADGVIYFRIVAVPSVFLSLMTVFGSILRAAGADNGRNFKYWIWPYSYVNHCLTFGIAGNVKT
jgi:Na+-driven multidrug efflux pump